MSGLGSNDGNVGTQYSVLGTQYAARNRNQRQIGRRVTSPARRADDRAINTVAFGRWQLTRRLPGGGRLQLFRAASAGDRGPGCYVVKSAMHRDVVGAAMLRRETTVAAEVPCPHLAPVVANEADCATPYIAQPYLDGVTLGRLVQWQADRGGVMAIRLALSVCRQIAAALAAMHETGWLHGQVRPEHVIVSPRGHATLIDLTQARRLGGAECIADVGGRSWPTYAAPEMFSASKQLTVAADVYSLGVMLFEALAGQLPFSGSPRELAARHRFDRPPEVRRWRPDAMKEVSALLSRMLAKQPLRRPSAEQVERWLAEIEIQELTGAGTRTCR